MCSLRDDNHNTPEPPPSKEAGLRLQPIRARDPRVSNLWGGRGGAGGGHGVVREGPRPWEARTCPKRRGTCGRPAAEAPARLETAKAKRWDAGQEGPLWKEGDNGRAVRAGQGPSCGAPGFEWRGALSKVQGRRLAPGGCEAQSPHWLAGSKKNGEQLCGAPGTHPAPKSVGCGAGVRREGCRGLSAPLPSSLTSSSSPLPLAHSPPYGSLSHGEGGTGEPRWVVNPDAPGMLRAPSPPIALRPDSVPGSQPPDAARLQPRFAPPPQPQTEDAPWRLEACVSSSARESGSCSGALETRRLGRAAVRTRACEYWTSRGQIEGPRGCHGDLGGAWQPEGRWQNPGARGGLRVAGVGCTAQSSASLRSCLGRRLGLKVVSAVVAITGDFLLFLFSLEATFPQLSTSHAKVPTCPLLGFYCPGIQELRLLKQAHPRTLHVSILEIIVKSHLFLFSKRYIGLSAYFSMLISNSEWNLFAQEFLQGV
ncbi:collagen alpha-1(I) chain-like [Nannospalax galili]|uniref:collagen alpha-1(I) chain-like n=1 Tax=Nannospalax galili TaxID=1026970 RepID=UPI00111C2508|nr:collagen alpha-1(I) chain-like [Nannospalax galili]